MKIKVALLYCGDFPDYFHLFLESCAKNSDWSWAILTDNLKPDNLPENIEWWHTDLEDVRCRLRDSMGINNSFTSPYKLCDFRPALAVLFPEVFRGTDYWGHCDCDVLFGDLSKFVERNKLKNYVKWQMRGAFSLYRNDRQGNNLFRIPHEKINYKEVFKNPKNCAFDEWKGLFRLVKEADISFYQDNKIAEIGYSGRKLTLTHHKNHPVQVFLWDAGRVLRKFVSKDGIVGAEEFSYIHLQKRKFHAVPDKLVGCIAILPRAMEVVLPGTDWQVLAKQNKESYIYLLKQLINRPWRYWKARKQVDRMLWKI